MILVLEKIFVVNVTLCVGYVLDVLARTALWHDGLDFRHGTGHGVGSYLNVHEGMKVERY
jgi:Xaa-Pro aminopeptidase